MVCVWWVVVSWRRRRGEERAERVGGEGGRPSLEATSGHDLEWHAHGEVTKRCAEPGSRLTSLGVRSEKAARRREIQVIGFRADSPSWYKANTVSPVSNGCVVEGPFERRGRAEVVGRWQEARRKGKVPNFGNYVHCTENPDAPVCRSRCVWARLEEPCFLSLCAESGLYSIVANVGCRVVPAIPFSIEWIGPGLDRMRATACLGPQKKDVEVLFQC